MKKNSQFPLYFVCFLSFFALGNNCFSAQIAKPAVDLLWPKGAPDSVGDKDGDKPSITVFLPDADKATGTGIIVCPGGAYTHIVSTYEGEDIARWLNKLGIAAFVLKYRVAPNYRNLIPLDDALRAVRYVRFYKEKYGLKSGQIGMIGFSAGGHLASTVITHFTEGSRDASDPIDAISSRPDFAILGYALITFLPPYTCEFAVHNLLGKNNTIEMRKQLSNELHVTPHTPAVFLFHSNRDTGVLPENSVLFYMALRKMNVPAELHIYEEGDHGTGLANGVGQAVNIPHFATWTMLAENWLKGRVLLTKSTKRTDNKNAEKSR